MKKGDPSGECVLVKSLMDTIIPQASVQGSGRLCVPISPTDRAQSLTPLKPSPHISALSPRVVLVNSDLLCEVSLGHFHSWLTAKSSSPINAAYLSASIGTAGPQKTTESGKVQTN